MTARILVVDDNAANRALLQAKLTAEYYTVSAVASGQEALDSARHSPPDVILLDVMMPGLSGYDVCRTLKADGQLSHIPIVMVTALDTPAEMVQGLECGADEFLTKPLDDLALFARVRSLVRLKRVLDEWRLRQPEVLGDAGGEALANEPAAEARLLLLTNCRHVQDLMASVAAEQRHDLRSEARFDPDEAAAADLILADLGCPAIDALRLCSQARSDEASRHVPFVLIGGRDQRELLFKGLDLGANEYLLRPLNRNEVTARLATQIRRRLQQRIQHRHLASLDQAMHDALTGLYNRHYLQLHLPRLHGRAMESGRPLGLIVCDLDHFKAVNDGYGHAAGDAVLREVAMRLAAGVRTPDLVTRFGGEEFIILLPDAGLEAAAIIAERLREAVAASPVDLPGGGVPVTASFGVSTVLWDECNAETAIRRADAALYKAKRQGRNRVVTSGAKQGSMAAPVRLPALQDVI
jgi:two-component system cell cycle response regulator